MIASMWIVVEGLDEGVVEAGTVQVPVEEELLPETDRDDEEVNTEPFKLLIENMADRAKNKGVTEPLYAIVSTKAWIP